VRTMKEWSKQHKANKAADNQANQDQGH